MCTRTLGEIEWVGWGSVSAVKRTEQPKDLDTISYPAAEIAKKKKKRLKFALLPEHETEYRVGNGVSREIISFYIKR